MATRDAHRALLGIFVVALVVRALTASQLHNPGYFDAFGYMRVAENGYRGIQKEFLKTDADGQLNLEGTVSVSGLGGNPYRDGSYEYYLSEKVVTNDPKGIGALLLAATEMENAVTINRPDRSSNINQ